MSPFVTNTVEPARRRLKDCSDRIPSVTPAGFMKTAAVIVVVALMTGTRTPAKAVIDDSLLVRIYDNAGVLASELAAALRTTHDILRRADLAWTGSSVARGVTVRYRPRVTNRSPCRGRRRPADRRVGQGERGTPCARVFPFRCQRCERIRDRLRGPRRLARASEPSIRARRSSAAPSPTRSGISFSGPTPTPRPV